MNKRPADASFFTLHHHFRRVPALYDLVLEVAPSIIVQEHWLPVGTASMRMRTHRKKSVKVPASGTGAVDLLTSDAVRGPSLVGRPITPMGCEPAVVFGRPATHPVELRARTDR